MKYRKPVDGARWFVNVDLIGKSAKELQRFVDSLPDEFEILWPGEVAVKWPEGLTRDYLRELADCVGRGTPRIGTFTALINLAAIAPERKGRRVNLWERECKDYIERRWVYEGEVLNDKVWRKVAGPIEIDD